MVKILCAITIIFNFLHVLVNGSVGKIPTQVQHHEHPQECIQKQVQHHEHLQEGIQKHVQHQEHLQVGIQTPLPTQPEHLQLQVTPPGLRKRHHRRRHRKHPRLLIGGRHRKHHLPLPTQPQPQPEPMPIPTPLPTQPEPLPIPTPLPTQPQPLPTQPQPEPLPIPTPLPTQPQPEPLPIPTPLPTQPQPEPEPLPFPTPLPTQPQPEPLPIPTPLPTQPQPEPLPIPTPLPTQPEPLPIITPLTTEPQPEHLPTQPLPLPQVQDFLPIPTKEENQHEESSLKELYDDIDDSKAQAYLTAHNDFRAKMGVPPLQWDKELEDYAQSYGQKRAADCLMQHSYGPYGENLFWELYEESSPEHIVKSLTDEQQNYDLAKGECKCPQETSKCMCGHFTAIIWRTTERVGCAETICEGEKGKLVICSYDPPGNVIGENPLHPE